MNWTAFAAAYGRAQLAWLAVFLVSWAYGGEIYNEAYVVLSAGALVYALCEGGDAARRRTS